MYSSIFCFWSLPLCVRFRGFASPYSGCGRALFTGSGPALFTGFGGFRGKGFRGVCIRLFTQSLLSVMKDLSQDYVGDRTQRRVGIYTGGKTEAQGQHKHAGQEDSEKFVFEFLRS
jgi:hypothetical protein